ncbi:carbohydrate porin [Vibrio sp. JC009]|uniref:carbohydrate porin n=1 Tax=Vibrio sp. JC009 TaxID=2912314 RepID=UPI0023AFB4F6|nr:carbohydrate porin [Vibrio sp. JC009]WED23885.1 carbohydrate porin [Vibrio sp. JC009]
MKLSKIALSCLIATSGLSVAELAMAEEGFEFHGSFRAGVLVSEDDDDSQRSGWAGATKEMVGRLGMEADNDFGVNLSKKWTLDNDKSVKVTVDVAEEEDDYSATNFPGAFVEYEGITDTGVLWGGKRDYLKSENYIFMTDFFYVDYSGTGIGLKDYEIGDTKLSVAYTASDLTGTDSDSDNRLMHTVHVGTDFGKVKIDAAAKYMGGNATDTNDYAEEGFDISATYSMDSFFGLEGNGFSKIIGQAGIGLGAQQLLGGSLTVYNAYRPGSVTKGGASGEDTIANNYDDDTSARLLLWGGYFLDNGINIFPSIQGQYNHHEEEGIYDYWFSAMVRPTFPVSENFYVQTEFGYAYKNWNGGTWFEKKATIAPTFVMGTGTGPAPEVRILASYLPEANGGDGDVVFGVQTDVWW